MLEGRYHITKVEEFADLKYHGQVSLGKQIAFIRAFLNFLRQLFRKRYAVYYGVLYLSFFGMLKNLLIVLSYKLLNLNGRVYLHIHRSDLSCFLERFKNRYLFKLLTNLVDQFIVLSEMQVTELNGMDIYNVSYLPNCVEKELVPDLNSMPNSKNFSFLFLSNFLEKKGLLDLIDAISIVNEKRSAPVFFELVGNYSNEISKERLQDLVKNNPYVQVGNPVQGMDKFKAIQRADALILPSYNEGLPLVLLESLSLAKPILISPVGYITEVLGNNYPYFIEPGNISSIVNRINDLVDNFSINLKSEMYQLYKPYSLETHKRKLFQIFTE
ncbi:glycosyltransferase family 4 protein [Aquirufa sp. OSTEICH-129V]|uniref:Glycosyltransferase family 4 protein n=1 Tax=Aquirufa avitistagni TaxID=3104728 RepID=A0ABW6DDZ6_9BACT